jgi:D-arabinose 1-dehydrogenase-like Zn-dependent alcohol dehydrogenase
VKDVLGYEGKRVIVTGAAGGVGVATTALLVELGAEVHAVDLTRPEVPGIASFSECDLDDHVQIVDTVKRIGAYLNAVFLCAPVTADTHQRMCDATTPLLLPGSAVATVVAMDGVSMVTGTGDLRSNCVRIGTSDATAVAWLLAFLNSPRASAVTGATLAATA